MMNQIPRTIGFALAIGVATAALELSAVSGYVTGGADLATLEIDGDITFHQTGATPPNPALVFTLSADREFPKHSYQLYPHNGREIRFDFSEGNHTLSFASGANFFNYPGWGTYAYPSATNRVVFKGGAWDFGNRTTVNFFGRWGYSMKHDGNEFVLDGTVITNAAVLYAMNCPINSRVRLVNGTRFYHDAKRADGTTDAAPYIYFAFGNSDRKIVTTNCSFSIESGSRFVSKGAQLQVDSWYWNGGSNGETRYLDDIGDFRLLVSGAGSFLGAKILSLGNVGGTVARFSDGACGELSNIYLGNESHAKAAGLVIEGGATVTNAASFYQGYVAGADRTRVSVRNGSKLALRDRNGNRFHMFVGSKSAFNEMTVSNSTFECFGLYLGNGDNPNATNNTLRLLGENLVLDHAMDAWTPFTTANNTLIIGDHAFVTLGSNKNFFHARTATGNELIVEDGAELRASYIYIGEDYATSVPKGQRVIVRNGGILHATTQISNGGDGAEFVVSNGTLQADNQYAMYFGYTSSNAKHAVTDNRVILQGDSPKMRSASDKAIFNFASNTVLRIEIPISIAYAETPILCDQLTFNDTSTVEIGNVTAARKGLAETKNVMLAKATSGLGLSSAKIAAVNEQLAAEGNRGCRLYRATNGEPDASGKELWLRVYHEPQGLSVIIR